ncbi:MAG TPA: beta-L-arabinofuranosidase domain-containing protein [Chloroflexota bacterium]|nr:beta-L-arabinofuranosidase domain-containing protein [Chloroflexota bacterium]
MDTGERSQRGTVIDTGRSPHARLRPVPIGAVRLADGFWKGRLETTRQVTLLQQLEQCEATGRIDNFRRAVVNRGGKKETPFRGRYYDDSDVYKWVEAASYALAGGPDEELRGRLRGVAEEIAGAQGPDGYLNTYYTFERAGERWTDLTRMHEMYCAGHLLQGAIAMHRATGERLLLDVAVRLADHICDTFGPQGRAGTDGHEEIELALVELYRETGDARYLRLAGFLLDQRGATPPLLSGTAYHQDHLPVREQREIVGHAVRATYLACGMTDVYAETGEQALLEGVQSLWESAFRRKAYVTGGLGARWAGEAFGEDYELPNATAYAETCAAIGGLMWNWRLLAVEGEGRYADWMEAALYNGILSGISLDGRTYFYQNPLADRGGHRRQPWFGTACCPPNIARTLLSLPGYLYSTSAEGVWVHHFGAGEVEVAVPGSRGRATLEVQTRYPWDGEVRVGVRRLPPGGGPWTLYLRLPGWCDRPRVRINGEPAGIEERPGTYVALRRAWQEGNEVTLDLPMPVRRLRAHPHVLADTGRVALARGPLVYCLEATDHPGVDPWDVVLPEGAELVAEVQPGLLGGVTRLRGEGVVRPAAAWEGALYREGGTAPAEAPGQARTAPLSAVPYFAWANRDAGPMQVWLRSDPGPG